MTNRRMSTSEMKVEYPNQWLFIIDCEIQRETTQLLSGIVHASSEHRHHIDKVSRNYKGGAAIHYTGQMPEGRMYLL